MSTRSWRNWRTRLMSASQQCWHRTVPVRILLRQAAAQIRHPNQRHPVKRGPSIKANGINADNRYCRQQRRKNVVISRLMSSPFGTECVMAHMAQFQFLLHSFFPDNSPWLPSAVFCTHCIITASQLISLLPKGWLPSQTAWREMEPLFVKRYKQTTAGPPSNQLSAANIAYVATTAVTL